MKVQDEERGMSPKKLITTEGDFTMKEENEVAEVDTTKAEVAEKPAKTPTKAELAKVEAVAFDLAHPEGDTVFFGAGPFPVISRAAAIVLGLTRYNTGTPCKEGHDSPRKVKTSACLACARLKLRDRHKRRLQDDADYKVKFAEKAKARRLARKEERSSAQITPEQPTA